jgi:hypothetical protein
MADKKERNKMWKKLQKALEFDWIFRDGLEVQREETLSTPF